MQLQGDRPTNPTRSEITEEMVQAGIAVLEEEIWIFSETPFPFFPQLFEDGLRCLYAKMRAKERSVSAFELEN